MRTKLLLASMLLSGFVQSVSAQNGRVYDECNAGVAPTWFGNTKIVSENSTWSSRNGDVYRYALDNVGSWAYMVYEVPAGAAVSKMIVDFYSPTGAKPTLAVKDTAGKETKYVQGWDNGMPTETQMGENLYRYVLPKDIIPDAQFQGCVYLDANTDVEIMRVVTEYGTGYVKPDDNLNADFSRLEKFLGKLEAKEDVTIAVLGGSMTAGANSEPFNPNFPNCYGARLKYYFETKYGIKVNFINAGIGSTNSFFGAIRAEEHLLKQNPDLVVIEYACNDQREEPYLGFYESLIRKVLKAPGKPAVMATMLCTQAGITLSDIHIPIAQYYKLPIVNYNEEIKNEVINGAKTWADYYAISTNPNGDGVHPNTLAHQNIADIITNICETRVPNINASITNEMSPIKYNNSLEDAFILLEKDITPQKIGTWSDGDNNKWLMINPGGKGWRSNKINSELIFDFTGDVAAICYWRRPANENHGKAEIWVDNNEKITLDSNGDHLDQLVLRNLGTGNHKLHIKVLENKYFEISSVAFSGERDFFNMTNLSIKPKAFSHLEFCFVRNKVYLMIKGMPFTTEYTSDGYLTLRSGSNYISVEASTGNLIESSTLTDAAKFLYVDKGSEFALRSVLNGKYVSVKTVGTTHPFIADAEIVTDTEKFFTENFIEGPITSVTDVSTDSYTVYGSNNTIYVKNANKKSLIVYSATGDILYKEPSVATDTLSISMSKGIYIVTLDNKAYKVAI